MLSRRFQVGVFALAFAAIAVVVACGGGGDDPTPTPEHHVVSGATTLDFGDSRVLGGDFRIINTGEACVGSGPYDDIREGGAVTVRDEAGTVIATAGLDEGEWVQSSPGHICVHTFNVDVPLADLYSFEVVERGEISYSYDVMTDSGWTVEFSLE